MGSEVARHRQVEAQQHAEHGDLAHGGEEGGKLVQGTS